MAKPKPTAKPKRSRAIPGAKVGRRPISPPGVPPCRIAIPDLGPYPARCLAQIREAMAGVRGQPPTNADAVRFAVWLAAANVAKWTPAHVKAAMDDFKTASGGQGS